MTNSPTALQPATRSLGRPSPMFYIDVETSQILRDGYTGQAEVNYTIASGRWNHLEHHR